MSVRCNYKHATYIKINHEAKRIGVRNGTANAAHSYKYHNFLLELYADLHHLLPNDPR